jgi:predicted HTH domain antitoxin
MSDLAVPFPEDILKTVHRTADEFAADVRLASAVEWYRRGLVSQGRGAAIAGLSRADFIDALAAREVDVLQFDPADLDEELKSAR